METPISDEALRSFPVFTAEIAKRLDNGRREYGDVSFTNPLLDTLHELSEELLDQAGWAFVNWIKLQDRIRALESVSGGNGVVSAVRGGDGQNVGLQGHL